MRAQPLYTGISKRAPAGQQGPPYNATPGLNEKGYTGVFISRHEKAFISMVCLAWCLASLESCKFLRATCGLINWCHRGACTVAPVVLL